MGPHSITRATRDHRATNLLSIAIAPPSNGPSKTRRRVFKQQQLLEAVVPRDSHLMT